MSALRAEALAFVRQGLFMMRPGPTFRAHGASEHLTVFIHGYLATCAVFEPMSTALARAGIAPRQLHFTYAPRGSVESLTRALDERIRALGHDGPVRIVGHSMGGLVGRYYRQVLGRPLERLVCLATPHAGTTRARFYSVLPLAAELTPGSETLRRLHETRHLLADVRVCSILAEDDMLIAPVESAALDGHPTIRVPNIGHQSMLLDARVIEHVASALSAGHRNGGR